MDKETLILNPTENIPMDLMRNFDDIAGLYISDNQRNDESKVIFGGRDTYTDKFSEYKKNWCNILKSAGIDFRCLSGLHAHIIAFMSLGNIGDTILLLPEEAGGHYSTENILNRLGYNVISAKIDYKNFCIDKDETLKLISETNSKFAFIDRSEGLYYEDFSWIKESGIPYCVFDASQYLTNILSGSYISPFDMGFDLILSTLHKNFPGPQKALLATKSIDSYWHKIISGTSTFISNSHPEEMFMAGESIKQIEKLKIYSNELLRISKELESNLYELNVNVLKKDDNKIPTQHIWVLFDNKNICYSSFKNLEKIGLYTNYRLLPYRLGYGLRIGVGGAIQSGLRKENVSELAKLISECINKGYSSDLNQESRNFIKKINKNGKLI